VKAALAAAAEDDPMDQVDQEFGKPNPNALGLGRGQRFECSLPVGTLMLNKQA
jgi:hypothetical protein